MNIGNVSTAEPMQCSMNEEEKCSRDIDVSKQPHIVASKCIVPWFIQLIQLDACLSPNLDWGDGAVHDFMCVENGCTTRAFVFCVVLV